MNGVVNFSPIGQPQKSVYKIVIVLFFIEDFTMVYNFLLYETRTTTYRGTEGHEIA